MSVRAWGLIVKRRPCGGVVETVSQVDLAPRREQDGRDPGWSRVARSLAVQDYAWSGLVRASA